LRKFLKLKKKLPKLKYSKTPSKKRQKPKFPIFDLKPKTRINLYRRRKFNIKGINLETIKNRDMLKRNRKIMRIILEYR